MFIPKNSDFNVERQKSFANQLPLLLQLLGLPPVYVNVQSLRVGATLVNYAVRENLFHDVAERAIA